MFLSVVLPFSSQFWLLAFCFGCFCVFSSAQKQPKQNASSQNCEENGSTTLRNTREKALLAGYVIYMSCFDRFTKLKRSDDKGVSVLLISFAI